MKKPKSFQTEIIINASREKVWDALYTRFGETYLYNPNLDGSHFVTGSKGEVGCVRQCDMNAKTKIVEKIVNAKELKSFSIDIVGGNMPFVEQGRINIELTTIGTNQTKVIFEMHYTSKPAFMAAMMKGMMRTKLTDVLIGLKYYLETGNAVSKKSYKPVYKKFRLLGAQQSFT